MSNEATLKKPARVGNTIFHVGVSERLVVERAQREYERQNTPEKVAYRKAALKKAIQSLRAHRKERH